MRQEIKKLKETIYFAYLCGNGILGDVTRKATQWSGLQHQQDHNEMRQNNHAKNGGVRNEIPKMIHETANLHEIS